MLDRFRTYLAHRREHRACNELRRTFVRFGYPADMTNEDIKAGLARLSEIMPSIGVSSGELAERLKAWANA